MGCTYQLSNEHELSWVVVDDSMSEMLCGVVSEIVPRLIGTVTTIPELKEQLITDFLADKHDWEKIASPLQNRCLALGFKIERSQRVQLDGTPHSWADEGTRCYSPSLAKSQRQDLMKRLQGTVAELQPLTLLPTSGRRRVKTQQALETKVAKILKTHDAKPFFSITYERHVKRRFVRGILGKPSRYEEKVSYVLRFSRDEKAIHKHRRTMG